MLSEHLRERKAAQWHLKRCTNSFSEFMELIPNIPVGCYIYVADSGIRYEHLEFLGIEIRHLWSYNGDDGADNLGHGTQVCSILCGRSLGLAPNNVRLVNVKVTDTNRYSSMQAIEGFYRIRDDILVNIWEDLTPIALYSSTCYENPIYDKPLNDLVNAGAVFVTISGNEGRQISRRPEREGTLTIGAIDFLNVVHFNHGPLVDLFAPGVMLTTADARSNSGYLEDSGTSFAAPLVAGAAAILSMETKLHAQYIIQVLKLMATEGKILYLPSVELAVRRLLRGSNIQESFLKLLSMVDYFKRTQ